MLTSTVSSAAGAALGADHADRPRDDPVVDRAHQVEALGDGQEGGRAGSARRRRRASAAAARTGVASPVARSTIGCACSTKRVLGERVADHVGPRDARLDPRLGPLRRVVGGELVAAGLLGVVHREVGVDEHVLAGQPLGLSNSAMPRLAVTVRVAAGGGRHGGSRTASSTAAATESASSRSPRAAGSRTRRRRGGRARRTRAGGAQRAGDARRSARRRPSGRACR